MSCEQWVEAISALADGEAPDVEPALLDAHLARCPSCRGLDREFQQLRRRARLGAAASLPDLSGQVVRVAALADRTARRRVIRLFLAAVTVYLVALSATDLFAAGQGESVHTSRHLGAFTLAYGVSLAVVVARPARARTVLPVACTLAVCLLLTAIVDIAAGNVELAVEGLHLPEFFSVWLVWLLAAPTAHRPDGRGHLEDAGMPELRLVDRPDADGPAASTG